MKGLLFIVQNLQTEAPMNCLTTRDVILMLSAEERTPHLFRVEIQSSTHVQIYSTLGISF